MISRRPSSSWIFAAALAVAGGWAFAQTPAAPARPSWADEPLEASNRATVARVVPGSADIVVLDGGLYQGIRTGVLCVVERADATDAPPAIVARLVVVASQPEHSAALITALGANVTLRPGDQVRLETSSEPAPTTNVL
jgi:hypothetical protein